MNLQEVCRFCLIKSSKNSDEIFFMIDESIKNKFEEVTQSQLTLKTINNESYPSKVCSTCITELEQHHNYRNGLIEKQKRLNLLIGVVAFDDHDEEIEKVIVKTNTHDTPVTVKEEFVKSDSEVIKFIEEEDEIQQDEEELDYLESQFEEPEEIHEEEELTEEIENENVEYEMLDQEDEEEIEEDEDIEQETYQSADCEEYEYVEYGEELETTEVEQMSTSKRRKYNKKPKDTMIFSCWFANCNHRSSFRSAMKRHLQQSHQVSITNTTCLICEHAFDTYSEYLKHIKSHTRKSQCDICMMTFLNDENLEKHKSRVHDSKKDGERNFECEICQARFKRQEHVNSHMSYKHSDSSERKFACNQCPSTFFRRSDLKTHEKGHDQVMMQCIYCDYSRRDVKSLRRHCLKVHNSTKLYRCVCDTPFDTHRELQIHKKHCSGPSVIDSSTELNVEYS